MPIGDKKGNVVYPGYDPLEVPNSPTGISSSGETGGGYLDVSFTAPTNTGGASISSYSVATEDGVHTATGSSSPVRLTGLTDGTLYNFRVWALNSYGPGPFGTGSGTPPAAIGLIQGGNITSGRTATVDYINIGASSGDSTDFGDLTQATENGGSGASETRALFGGGSTGSNQNVISYTTFDTTGSYTDFGDLTTNREPAKGTGMSSSTRCVFGAGYQNNPTVGPTNTMDYVTIASTGNATDFGDAVQPDYWCEYMWAAASPTRGLSGGASATAQIGYITIASTGNATNFGDATATESSSFYSGALSNNTRACVNLGGTSSNVIYYVTIATTGNGTDFGDLTVSRGSCGTASTPTKGLWCGGYNTARSDVIDYVTIASTGNATDFGDLLEAKNRGAGASNAHGGLS